MGRDRRRVRLRMHRYPRCLTHSSQAVTLVAIGMALGCGMRGAPLAPLVFVPDAVTPFEVQRVDDEVHVRFEVPSENTDGSSPADLARVEVYALTTEPDPARQPGFVLEEWLEHATMIASVPVHDLPGGSSDDDGDGEVTDAVGPARQGQEVAFIERLTPDVRAPVPIVTDASDERATAEPLESADHPAVGPFVSPPLPVPPRRTYIAIAVSTRDRESAASRRVDVSLGDPTPAPSPPVVTYTESEFLLEWTAPLAARLPIQEPPADGVLMSGPIVELWPATTYSVYAVDPDGAVDASARPEPLNALPIAETSYVDVGVAFGIQRCYAVRTRDVIDSLAVQGPASPPTCVVPVDTFAPQAPVGLVAVADADAISLAWDAGAEADISGYLVLRGTAPGATLDRLTPEPITGTTYRDTNIESDQLYVYAVQAVDDAMPPNVSSMSVEVTERAR